MTTQSDPHISPPDVSIIMSTFNEKHWLGLCIASAFAQTNGNFEFLIVDDGSTDGSWEHLSTFKDPRLRLFRHETRNGWMNNMNLLAERARGRLIKFMCPDDLMKPECLKVAVAFYDKHPAIGYIATRTDDIDEDGRLLRRGNLMSSVGVLPSPIADRYAFFNGCPAPTSAIFVPRDKWIASGGMRDISTFNPLRLPIIEDYELLSRLQESYPAGILGEPLVEIRHSSQNVSHSPLSAELIVETNLKLLKALAARLVRSGTQTASEVDQYILRVAGNDYMHRAVLFLRSGQPRAAWTVLRAIGAQVPLHAALVSWIRTRCVGFIGRRLPWARAVAAKGPE